jgi:hypothetical protein
MTLTRRITDIDHSIHRIYVIKMHRGYFRFTALLLITQIFPYTLCEFPFHGRLHRRKMLLDLQIDPPVKMADTVSHGQLQVRSQRLQPLKELCFRLRTIVIQFHDPKEHILVIQWTNKVMGERQYSQASFQQGGKIRLPGDLK